MPDLSLPEVMDALADQLSDVLGDVIENLQVCGRLMFNPTIPSIDIYPADPFQEQRAFGERRVQVFFEVRARVTTADNVAGQDLLLSMMDPRAPESVVAALVANRNLDGTVENVSVSPPSNYGLFVDPGDTEGGYLGCTWRTGVIL